MLSNGMSKKRNPMMIKNKPENAVKRKKYIIWEWGIVNINTDISLISPAPITPNVNSKKPITNVNNAGRKKICLYWIHASGTMTKSNKNTILLLIILDRISVQERIINNITVIQWREKITISLTASKPKNNHLFQCIHYCRF